MILAGDVGGTKTVLGLFERDGAGLRPVLEQTYRNADFASFIAVLERFRDEYRSTHGPPSIEAASFAVAGPVVDGRAKMTNLTWIFDTSELAAALRTERVRLLNDLEGTAYGMLHLSPADFTSLNAGGGRRRQANAGLIAAGTGLGEALLCWDGTQYHPSASEGGHGDFAPRNEHEIDLLRHLQGVFGGHVSYERIVSGPGLVNVYRFLRDTGRAPEPPQLTERLATGDQAATIATAALAGEYDICVRALDLFVSVYGAEAGNVALRGFTLAGVYVAGGIAPKILKKLTDGTFMRAFRDKGRYRELLDGIPVTIADNPKAPMLGAAHFAARL